jgi:hypothetical protein
MSEPATKQPGLPTEAESSQLVAQANAGDADALKNLRELLENRPEIWQRVGDLAAHAEMLMVNLISAGNRLMIESLQRTLHEMKAELVGPATSMLERMAIDRLLACWLQLQYVDNLAVKSSGGTLPNANFQLKRQDAAHKRYAAAVKSLAELRRLLPSGTAGSSNKTPPAPLRVFTGDAAQADAASA